MPIVFVRHEGALWSPVDGKPKRPQREGTPLARLAHIAHEPRVALLLDHYDADWRRLWWIRVDGRAESRGAHAGVEAALRRRYPQYRDTPLFIGAPTLVRIEPVRITSWTASAVSSRAS